MESVSAVLAAYHQYYARRSDFRNNMGSILRLLTMWAALNHHVLAVDALEHGRLFKRGVLCDVSTRLAHRCMQSVGHTKNLLECAALGAKNPLSTGYSLDATSDNCYTHFECPAVSGCTQQDITTTQHIYYTTTIECLNEGTWDILNERCKCVNGWIGQCCEERATSCKDLYQWYYPHGMSTVFLNIPGSSQEWKAKCYRARGPEIRTYVFINGGYFNFNRTWTDYENGFFKENSNLQSANFFTGLRPVYLFNKAGLNEMALEALLWDNPAMKDSTKVSRIVQYIEDARIDDSTKNYTLNFKKVVLNNYGAMSSEIATQTSCLIVKKMPFSTRDRYSVDGDNHAATSGGGWWFTPDGSPCNVLGSRCRVTNVGPGCMAIADVPVTVLFGHIRFLQLYFREFE